MLCQKGIDEELGFPADAKHSTTGTCCNTLADNPLGFCKIDSLPNTTMDVARKDDGAGMQVQFQRNRVNGMIRQHPSSSRRGNESTVAEVPKNYTRQTVH